jgi:TolA-binding protein
MKSNNSVFRLEGAGLALVPLLVAIILGLLIMPRAALPSDVPLPSIDTRALALREKEENALIETQFERDGLSADVRALGSELRTLHEAEAKGLLKVDAARAQLSAMKEKVERARALAIATSGAVPVRTLFVVQKRAFLNEVSHLASGESDELHALAGDFMARMRTAGWASDRDVKLSREELSVFYKSMWAHDVGLELDPWFELSLNEKKVLFAVYLAKPRPPEKLRETFEEARKHAKGAAECAKVESERERAAEAWRAEKIEALAAFDPSYPKDYALGIANYRMGKSLQAQVLFRAWLEKHPSGPLAARAENYLKAASAQLEGR